MVPGLGAPQRFLFVSIVILTLILLNACGGTTSTAGGATPGGGTANVTVQLQASPASVPVGQSTTLTWSTTNASTVSLTPGGSANMPLAGNLKVSPTTTTTYTITAMGTHGDTATATATVIVTPAPVMPTITITATPATIAAGQFSTLAWQSTAATSVTITPAPPANDGQQTALSGSAAVVPTATTTYTATATGPGGTATATVVVTVQQGVPTVTLSASPTSIIAGQKSTLTWSSQNATKLSIDNGVGSVAAPSGTVDVSPGATTTYTITATGPGGSSNATATVTVQQQLGVTLSANPKSIAAGQGSTLTWTSQAATSVDIQPGVGPVNLNGSLTVKPTQTTTYTATAHDAGGNTKTATATVTLVPGGSLQSSIKHIIFFVQENRSFDNYFGFLGPYKASKGLANDVDGMPSNAVQIDRNGVAVHPYHYQTTCVENTSPSWNPSWDDWDNGKMDRFVNVTELPSSIDPDYHRAMGYYNQDDLPYYYELAAQFATSDRFFESTMAGTIPNRMYLFTGTSFGHIYPDTPPSGGFQQKTIFRALTDAGVNWRYYYLDNSIFLAQFADWQDPAIRGHVFNISDWFSTLADPAADDKLPAVVFIERPSSTGLDEHPDNNTQAGAAKAAQVINALLNSAAWKSSVFIHTYDEYGGLFDHVPIQSAPAPDNIAPICTPGFDAQCLPGDFAHTGFRIPLIVISPWVKAHFVSHTVRDTTSILKLIETRFGLSPLTARDAWADDMVEFFDFTNPAWQTPPSLPAQPTNQTCDFGAELNGQH